MKHTIKLILHLLITMVMRLAFRVFYIFPIKKNRVMFQAFREKQYSCNPKPSLAPKSLAAAQAIPFCDRACGFLFHTFFESQGECL